MTLEEFKIALVNIFNKACETSNIPATACIYKVWKINTFDEKFSIVMDQETGASPMISIQDIYQKYCREKCDLQKIAIDVLDTYLWYSNNETCNNFRKMQATDINMYKEKITTKGNLIPILINTNTNKDFISNLIHKQWMDLSIIYQLTLDRNKETSMSLYVTKALAKRLDISESLLYDMAMTNLEMSTILAHTTDLPSKLNNRYDNEIIAISARGEYGATGILNPKAIRFLAENYGDMYLLPASIDMFYAVKTDMDLPENLLEYVYEINQMIKPTERLSNNIYKLHANGYRIEMIRSEHKDLL